MAPHLVGIELVVPESLVNEGIAERYEDLSGLSSSFNGDNEELQEVTDEEQQEQSLRIVSPVSPARLYCCYVVIIILAAAVIALSVALSWSDFPA
ncbi:hypothetical protein LEMLEM_LOCUS13028 [Lemmus lemmus]